MMLKVGYYSARVLYHKVYGALSEILPYEQGRQEVTQRLLTHYVGYDLTGHVLEEKLYVGEDALQGIENAIVRLKRQEPIQYILGETSFLTYTFGVNGDVLIPRPETEEMVASLLQEEDLRGKRVLDIGTGSGCIAVTLKKECPEALVSGLDLLPEALAVARNNAERLEAEIHWYTLDILREEPPDKGWDLFVSNPPYVPSGERDAMSKGVVAYEPNVALFVPDRDPYVFYRRIADIGAVYLKQGGKVYVEYHADRGEAVGALFKNRGFARVRVYHDLQGRERWLVAER